MLIYVWGGACPRFRPPRCTAVLLTAPVYHCPSHSHRHTPLQKEGWALAQSGAPNWFPSATISSFTISDTNTALCWQFQFFSNTEEEIQYKYKLVLTWFKQKAGRLRQPLTHLMLFSRLGTEMTTLNVLIIVGNRTALLLLWRTQPENQPAVHRLRWAPTLWLFVTPSLCFC